MEPRRSNSESRRSARKSLLALDLTTILRSSSLTSRRVSSRPYDMLPIQRSDKDKADDDDNLPQLLKRDAPSRIPIPTHKPQKKSYLFGIPLPSPLKSSSTQSRPNTPSDVASNRQQGPPSSSLSISLVPGTGMRVSSAPEPQRKPSPSKIPTLKQEQNTLNPPPRTSKPKGAHISPSTLILEPGSSPTRRYMSEVGNTSTNDPPTPSPVRASTSVVGTRVRNSSLASPSQTHTTISTPRVSSNRISVASLPPATSPIARVRSLSTGASGSDIVATTRERRVSSESHVGRAYRAVVAARLDGIAEVTGQKLPSPHVSPSSSMPTATSKTSVSVGSVASRTKHGSFDFERPGWGSLAGRGTTLGIGPRTRRDAPRGSSVDESGRVRTTNAGMAGVGAARFYAATSGTALNRNVRVVPPPTPPALERSHTGNSASTSASRSNVAASSWGRATGKRLSAGFSKLTSGLGLGGGGKSVVSKASTVHAGKDRQHGKFPFEPPVSSPKMARRELSLDSQPEQRERVARPLSPGKGHNPSHSTSSTTSSTHTGVSTGHRSGTKGRSLDLGLGLAWAPTKVREDAVMPESSFGRTLSASRRERRGKELAEEFRAALDDDGFRVFKKYVHRFDTHEIPFDGPTGIVTRVERLLRKAQHLDEDERSRLLDNFVKLTLSAV
ncbi:hypothetical protein MKEN_00093100 [Mycena kentingensis (nom. inval.)]|nr:hypothetical protein MKEN_00093100 [Mycena kentingensis (nom. inval.)]